ncbi:unnamed protein product, partial [Protopolystoma xenopodis]
ESDSSELVDTSLVNADVSGVAVDERTKRIHRRIQRHLYHLQQRWSGLNTALLEYQAQLDVVYQHA